MVNSGPFVVNAIWGNPVYRALLVVCSETTHLYIVNVTNYYGGRSICESARLGSVQTRFRIPISIQFPYKHCNVSKLFHNNKPSHWLFKFVVLKKYGNLEFGICFGRNLAERIRRSTARLPDLLQSNNIWMICRDLLLFRDFCRYPAMRNTRFTQRHLILSLTVIN